MREMRKLPARNREDVAGFDVAENVLPRRGGILPQRAMIDV
jgi:hypothetical protein